MTEIGWIMKKTTRAKNGSKLLKLKAKIYQYTGFFLARKEQLAYVKSKHRRPTKRSSLTIGLWQVDNGFYRAYPRHFKDGPRDKNGNLKSSLYGKLYLKKFTKNKLKKAIVLSALFVVHMVFNIYVDLKRISIK